MSHIRTLALLLAATAFGACLDSTAPRPEPAAAREIGAPALNADSTGDSTSLSGYQPGHG